MGENIQALCDVYIGNQEDFDFNPFIKIQVVKQKKLQDIVTPFKNPFIVFCYTHCLKDFAKKLDFFDNPFILVSHNSDHNIEPYDYILQIVNHDKVMKVYSQNICFFHTKLHFLPIGLPNRMWCPNDYYDYFLHLPTCPKTESVFFNFTISTNHSKRHPCFEALKNKIPWIPHSDRLSYIKNLHRYKFCICPVGNGVDTHRLWECFYLQVIPIVIESSFTDRLRALRLPILILRDWDDYSEDLLVYQAFSFVPTLITFMKDH